MKDAICPFLVARKHYDRAGDAYEVGLEPCGEALYLDIEDSHYLTVDGKHESGTGTTWKVTCPNGHVVPVPDHEADDDYSKIPWEPEYAASTSSATWIVAIASFDDTGTDLPIELDPSSGKHPLPPFDEREQAYLSEDDVSGVTPRTERTSDPNWWWHEMYNALIHDEFDTDSAEKAASIALSVFMPPAVSATKDVR